MRLLQIKKKLSCSYIHLFLVGDSEIFLLFDVTSIVFQYRIDRLIHSMSLQRQFARNERIDRRCLLTDRRKVSRSSCRCIDLARMLIKHESGGEAFVTYRSLSPQKTYSRVLCGLGWVRVNHVTL